MQDADLLRYSRHIMLPQIDYAGQQALSQSHALIIGAGGLGSPVALYLAAAGVGQLTVSDFDAVDLSNLQRQIIHHTASVGINKAQSAQQTLQQLNPKVVVHAITHKTSENELARLVKQADVVLDCSDNAATRYLLNRVCFQAKKALVSGAAIRFEGQITVFDFRREDSPCYYCLYPQTKGEEGQRCAESGVFAPLVGMVGSMQAAEALKCLLNIGQTLQGRLLLLDALTADWQYIQFARDPVCDVCRKVSL